jgi:hypothetical protein
MHRADQQAGDVVITVARLGRSNQIGAGLLE